MVDMQSPLEKDYVLVEHGFEYASKDGTVISIKPHERYILLKKTNEHWWQVCRDCRSKPFYIPAKYVRVLSSLSQNPPAIFLPGSGGLPDPVPSTEYSYKFLPADLTSRVSADTPQQHGVEKRNVAANSLPSASLLNLSTGRGGTSLSLCDISVISDTQINPEKKDGGRTLGPLRTFHNSKKILDPHKRISFMCPPEFQPSIRPSQSMNDLQTIQAWPSVGNHWRSDIGHSMEHLSFQESCTAKAVGPSPAEKVVIEEEESIYVNLQEVHKIGSRERSSSQHHSSASTIDDWETHTDQGSGQLFYYNSATGETTWDCPFDEAEEPPITPASLSPTLGDADWEKLFDDSSGQYYFYNLVTGETSWDPPTEDELHPLEGKSMFSPYDSADRRPPTPEADYPGYSPQEKEHYPDADYDAPYSDDLSGWSCEMKDGRKLYTNSYNGEKWLQSQDQYGKTFYYSPESSLSQWRLPQLAPPDSHRGDPNHNNIVITSWRSNSPASPLQKDSEVQTKGLEKAGVLQKTKTAENGKRLRKNWTSSWTVLEGGILTFFRDSKNLSSNSMQSLLAMPEHTVKLHRASLSWAAKDKSSKKHVMELKTQDGSEYLIHHDSETITADWFSSISKSISKDMQAPPALPSELPESESRQEFGSTERLGMKDDKRTAAQNNNMSDSDRNVRAKLRKFLQRRPTLQSLRDKGYIRDQVFGCHLHHLCDREKRNVPTFVSKSIEAVERRGLDIDGLYRVSGNLAVIQRLRHKVDHDENFSLEDGKWEDVHVITGALKLFFRELPEPLFPFSHFNNFVEAIKLSDQNQKMRRLRELILSLPPPNLETMRILFKHLCGVVENKDLNRMSVQSVAIVFGPTLLRPEEEGGNIAMYMIFQNQIVEQILNHYQYIFSS
ncbi:rho GTPase-activating protein 27 isoform X2 [Hyperolius riggenbachi]|uniref:rho GTPase-activating protein 27 isoform X2 n=1 Tax=Hyperolius riggenbachi TaxID=752182 RepID=UPI0035A34654